jgi:hypothetical protein
MSLLSYALTTEQRVADFGGLGTLTAGSDTYNTIQRLINSVTNFVENYCNRRFKKTTYTNEEISVDQGSKIMLKNYPVVSGSAFSLQFRDSGLNEDDWESLDSTYYFLDYDNGIVTAAGQTQRNSGYVFRQGYRNYRVTYTAGYDFDNTTTFLSDAGCADLEYIVWKLVITSYEKRRGVSGISSERIGDYSVTYTKEAFENDEIKEVLDKYAKTSYLATQLPTQF